MVMALNSAGYNAKPAASCSEALLQVRDNHFDIVIADLYLNFFNGKDLKWIINRHYKHVKVFIMSGDPGYDLVKPFDINDLERLIKLG
jgi:DNA-binding NtrC family response regulator